MVVVFTATTDGTTLLATSDSGDDNERVKAGPLAVGTYYVKVTESNGLGETTPSIEASVTIASGNIPQVTFAALQAGNSARNVYVGTASGAEVLYASGITAGTYSTLLNEAVAPPALTVPVSAPVTL